MPLYNPPISAFTWSVATINKTLVVNTGTFANKGTLLSLALPASSAVGDVIRVVGENVGLWEITQGANQYIKFGNQATAVGVGGFITSVLTYDSVELVCMEANLGWEVISSVGNIIVADPGLYMQFDAIANASLMIGGDATVVADWNIFFNLPTNGTPFTSVGVTGSWVNLKGGSGITLSAYLFGDNDPGGTSLLHVVDLLGCVIACENGVFSDFNIGLGCFALTKIHLPACVTLGNEVFADCVVLADLTLPFSSYTTLGNDVFNYVIMLPQYDFPNLVSAGLWCFASYFGLVNPDFSSLTTAGSGCFINCTGLINPDFSSLITADSDCFQNCFGLINPNFSSLVTAGTYCFQGCTGLINLSFPVLADIGSNCFQNWVNITNLDLPSCINLGGTTGDNFVFLNIIGNIITLTIPSALMTCNGGSPDGDIQYLQANNTVTIIIIP